MDANFQAPAYALIFNATYASILPRILQVSRGPTADSLQFSLLRGLVPEAALEGKEIRKMLGKMYIFVHLYMYACVYTQISI